MMDLEDEYRAKRAKQTAIRANIQLKPVGSNNNDNETVESDEAEGIDITKLKMSELVKLAKERGISVHHMKKQELIDLLLQ